MLFHFSMKLVRDNVPLVLMCWSVSICNVISDCPFVIDNGTIYDESVQVNGVSKTTTMVKCHLGFTLNGDNPSVAHSVAQQPMCKRTNSMYMWDATCKGKDFSHSMYSYCTIWVMLR